MLETDMTVLPRSRPAAPGVRHSLRAATAQAHERLDACARRVSLADRESYGRFLQAQSGPVMALEAALHDFGVARLLPDWPLRSRAAALRHDLEYLRLPTESSAAIRLTSAPQAFGTLYVLEGSRLGARVLLQQILAAAPELKPATRFFSHGSDHRLWTTFLQDLEAKVGVNDLPGCTHTARAVLSLCSKPHLCGHLARQHDSD